MANIPNSENETTEAENDTAKDEIEKEPDVESGNSGHENLENPENLEAATNEEAATEEEGEDEKVAPPPSEEQTTAAT